MQPESAKNAPYQNMNQGSRYPDGNPNNHHNNNYQQPYQPNQHGHNQNPNMGYNYPTIQDNNFANHHNHQQNPKPLYIEPEAGPFLNDNNSSYGRICFFFLNKKKKNRKNINE